MSKITANTWAAFQIDDGSNLMSCRLDGDEDTRRLSIDGVELDSM